MLRLVQKFTSPGGEVRGPELELTLTPRSSFFCNQVFFVYDPSSSTSLLSSVGITTRETGN